jgi:hypothetical protein
MFQLAFECAAPRVLFVPRSRRSIMEAPPSSYGFDLLHNSPEMKSKRKEFFVQPKHGTLLEGEIKMNFSLSLFCRT